jgi:ketosteroid isomerase-like protein
MAMSREYVAELFDNLRTGKSELFFAQVSDHVEWRVMGTHPLAGSYHGKADFQTRTFKRLDKVLREGVVLKVNGIIVSEDTAVVEMESLSTAMNGRPFNNTYCWICRFENNVIVEVRAYLDSALVQRLIDENETRGQ